MSLEPIPRLLSAASRGHYALGYFESWNLESLQGVIDAAEQTRSPIILGFNGEFLSDPARRTEERLAVYAALGRAAAASTTVPCGLIFNECPDDARVAEAAAVGFNLLMPADPHASYEDYSRRVRSLTEHAHAHGAAVEAEIGVLPCGAGNLGHSTASSTTDPEIAARFVAETGIDLLAVSVGNTHITLSGSAPLNLDLLARIHHRVSIPLVLHGGSGIAADSIRTALDLGVRKVNYGTYLKQRYLEAIRRALAPDIANPHALLGIGGDHDVLVAGRLAVRDAVLERIDLLGCCGKA
jgi:ketose-bisphosphate aldolase